MTSAIDNLIKYVNDTLLRCKHLRLALIEVAYSENDATVASLSRIALDALNDDQIACEILEEQSK